jgi:general secretion pathway protein C
MDLTALKSLKMPATLGLVQLNTLAPPWVSLLFVILLAQSAATLVWQVAPIEPLPPAPARFESTASAQQSQSPSMIKDIASMQLFGMLQKDLPKLPPQETVAPDTTLRLILKGVFASNRVRDAFAIIADSSGMDETYRVEDSIPGGAVLKEIHADRVILFHNNRFETLRLPQDQVSTGMRPERQSRRDSAPRRTVTTGRVNTVNREGVAILKNYRQKLINDPQSVMSAVRAEPFRRGGKIEGYRIFPGRDRELLRKVGLQPGDIVTSVNGIELDSPLKGLEIMQQITDAPEVSVNVKRNGVNQTFVVPLN